MLTATIAMSLLPVLLFLLSHCICSETGSGNIDGDGVRNVTRMAGESVTFSCDVKTSG